ncbi:MAG: DNA repair protein RadC [Planctomycetota bacterium]|nr:DNA repair protein RadC [Planctomycetota bacterium]MDA1112720.1 DNA repair protein RadC [Planctomycetota bacterium]
MSTLSELTRPLSCWKETELLASFGVQLPSEIPLARIAGLEPADLAERFALEPAAAQRLAAAMELGRRALHLAAVLQPPIAGGEDVYRYLAPKLSHLPCEVFYVLYLDSKGRLLFEAEISRGTLSSSLVHPREVFAPALSRRAAAILVAHNHPSGDPQPSADDRTTTRRLQRAGHLLGIELLDHIVIGSGNFLSFLEEGWL